MKPEIENIVLAMPDGDRESVRKYLAASDTFMDLMIDRLIQGRLLFVKDGIVKKGLPSQPDMSGGRPNLYKRSDVLSVFEKVPKIWWNAWFHEIRKSGCKMSHATYKRLKKAVILEGTVVEDDGYWRLAVKPQTP